MGIGGNFAWNWLARAELGTRAVTHYKNKIIRRGAGIIEKRSCAMLAYIDL
jgi:hypothetical protein